MPMTTSSNKNELEILVKIIKCNITILRMHARSGIGNLNLLQ